MVSYQADDFQSKVCADVCHRVLICKLFKSENEKWRSRKFYLNFEKWQNHCKLKDGLQEVKCWFRAQIKISFKLAGSPHR